MLIDTIVLLQKPSMFEINLKSNDVEIETLRECTRSNLQHNTSVNHSIVSSTTRRHNLFIALPLRDQRWRKHAVTFLIAGP
jgi:hypothetical protein